MNILELQKNIISLYNIFYKPVIGMNNIKNNLLPKIYDDLENNENFIKYFNKNKLGSKRRLKYKNDYILKCLIEENKFKFNIFEKSLKEYYDLENNFIKRKIKKYKCYINRKYKQLFRRKYNLWK